MLHPSSQLGYPFTHCSSPLWKSWTSLSEKHGTVLTWLCWPQRMSTRAKQQRTEENIHTPGLQPGPRLSSRKERKPCLFPPTPSPPCWAPYRFKAQQANSSWKKSSYFQRDMGRPHASQRPLGSHRLSDQRPLLWDVTRANLNVRLLIVRGAENRWGERASHGAKLQRGRGNFPSVVFKQASPGTKHMIPRPWHPCTSSLRLGLLVPNGSDAKQK